jgi:hypothetical protein
MEPNILRDFIAALATSRPQNTLPPVPLPPEAPPRYQAPPIRGFWHSLFGDPYTNLVEEHKYIRFKTALEAETEEFQHDVAHAQDRRDMKRHAEKAAYNFQSQVWLEVEKLKSSGFAELAGTSALNELIDTMETMGLTPHQQKVVIHRLHALFSMPLQNKDLEDEIPS